MHFVCFSGALRVLFWCSSCALVFFLSSCAHRVLFVCSSCVVLLVFWRCFDCLLVFSCAPFGALRVLFVCSSSCLLVLFWWSSGALPALPSDAGRVLFLGVLHGLFVRCAAGTLFWWYYGALFLCSSGALGLLVYLSCSLLVLQLIPQFLYV